MTRFNFEALSPQDFEELTRDLLQAVWGAPVEAFRTGPDQGIDLRHFPVSGGATIVQCKHYLKSGVQKLIWHLVKHELPKIRKMSPTRYLVATTVRLSPSNKTEICKGLAPFILQENDILGADDIEGLLALHPDVVEGNFKLWLTSAAVLKNVLHNAEKCRSEFEVQRVSRKLPLFVKSRAFEHARKMLDKNRVLIISGPPGIGKTTLAEMLLFAHLDRGYEPVAIESDIKEARTLFRHDKSQIFYFDDFLGQIFLGDARSGLSANQDKAIVNLIEMVRSSKASRFILTTREHILRNAARFSERLSHSPAFDDRLVLSIGDYSFGQRARILYNHVYFSKLPAKHRQKLVQDDFFLKIINHRNVNPRLIEWLTSVTRLKNVSADHFRDFILDLLNHPIRIWEFAYRNEISDAARSAVLCLYTVGDYCDQEDFEPAFSTLHSVRSKQYNFRTHSSDFRDALRELDGAFLSFSHGRISFINPSIKDYVSGVIKGTKQDAIDLMHGAVRFKQLSALWKLRNSSGESELAKALDGPCVEFVIQIESLLSAPEARWLNTGGGRMIGTPVDSSLLGRIKFLAELIDNAQSASAIIALSRMSQILVESAKSGASDVCGAIRLIEELSQLERFLNVVGFDTLGELAATIVEQSSYARADEWIDILEFRKSYEKLSAAQKVALDEAYAGYQTSGVNDEIADTNDVDEKRALREKLERLGEKSGGSFDEAMSDLGLDIERLEEDEEHILNQGSEDLLLPRDSSDVDNTSEEDVREMFTVLIDV